jgi:hypothetical protein
MIIFTDLRTSNLKFNMLAAPGFWTLIELSLVSYISDSVCVKKSRIMTVIIFLGRGAFILATDFREAHMLK